MWACVALLLAALVCLWAYAGVRQRYWASRGVTTEPHCWPVLGHLRYFLSPTPWLLRHQVVHTSVNSDSAMFETLKNWV